MPVARWRIDGGSAVREEIVRNTKEQEKNTKTTKETAAEISRLDRLSREVWKRQATDVEKYERATKDLLQVLNTSRGVTRQMAEQELQRLKEQYLGTGEAAKKAAAQMARANAESLKQFLDVQQMRTQANLQGGKERYARMVQGEQARYELAESTNRQILADQQQTDKRRTTSLREAIQERFGVRKRGQKEVADSVRRANAERMAEAETNRKRETAALKGAAKERYAAVAANERAAAAIVDRNLSPLQRYKRDYRELIGIYKRSGMALADKRREAMRLRGALLDAGQAGQRAFGSAAAARASAYFGSIAGVSGVVSAITRDMSELDRMASSRAQTQRTVAQAERELRIGIAAEPPEVREKIMNTANAIAEKQSLNRVLVYDTTRKATSASPDSLEGLKNAQASLGVTAGTPGADAFAGAVGDIRGALGADDPNEAIGFALRSLTKARIEEAPQLGKNLSRVLAFGNSVNADPKVTASVFNAINQGAADPQGELSRTASIQLIRQLDDYFKAQVGEGRFKASAVDELSEQRATLLSNKRLRNAFLDDSSFESGALGAVREFLSGKNASVNEAYDRTLSGLDTDLAAVGREAGAFINGSSLQRGDRANRAIEELDETYKVRSPVIISQENEVRLADARFRAIRESGQSYLPTSRVLPFLDRTLVGASQRIEAGADITDEEAIGISRRTLQGLEFKQQEYGAPAGPEYQALLRMTEKLERIVGSSMESAEAQKAIADAFTAPPADLQQPREE